MHTAKRLTTGLELTVLRPESNDAVHRRRLGRAYRLILNYDPQKAASTRAKLDEIASEKGPTRPTTGWETV